MRLRITIAMLEIRNRETLQSKVNICKSDVKIGDYADSLHHLLHPVQLYNNNRYSVSQNSELRTQKFIQHNSQRLSASNNANLLL